METENTINIGDTDKGHHNHAELKLNIGCGSTVANGWVNIDRSLNIYLSRIPRIKQLLFLLHLIPEEVYRAKWNRTYLRLNVERGLPFDSCSVDYIYSSHLLEHLSRSKAKFLLMECFRVLKPKGVLRLAVPDLSVHVSKYIRMKNPDGEEYDDRAADIFMEELGVQKELPLLLRVFGKGNQHLWMYDSSSLTSILSEIGFGSSKQMSFRDGNVPDLESIEFRENSLFVESSK